ncbi:glutaminyl-peptide cyclotransferase [Candidatus Bathyarchaeota archaeon]|nr:glutaminyl-peptide cyclotransferase [Candidatus Bathyarchaeota archaeon]
MLVLRDRGVVHYVFEVVDSYPHDQDAFTQGLAFEDGVLYESTGLYGKSSLRCVELESGYILQIYNLSNEFFGEGMTIFNDRIIQLTWKEHKGFVYNKTSFELLEVFDYSNEGWGLTHDGQRLIMSDGSANLYFLDPDSFETLGQIEVRYNGSLVSRLNELEYVKGDIYANIWLTEQIVVIDPFNGQVKAWIDCTSIKAAYSGNVLNGIAYDVEGDRLFITGKLWSELFQVKLVEV